MFLCKQKCIKVFKIHSLVFKFPRYQDCYVHIERYLEIIISSIHGSEFDAVANPVVVSGGGFLAKSSTRR